MKRGILFIFIILSFIISNSFIISAETGIDPITGKATTQQVSLSIFVIRTTPYIQIISPKNETYLKNESLLLDYTVLEGDSVWYNIDNSANTTINSSIQFNVSQGQHTIYLFANNSNSTISSSVVFTANSNKFIIYYENYKGSAKGSSTNFIDYTYEEIQNISNVILENTNYGKIKFNEAINLTNDRENTDNLLDIDSNALISSNHIEIKETEIPNFNKYATLWLYNINFTNPRILKDGVVCPSTICTKENYINNTLKFNVTEFSIYSAEETPTEVPPVEEKIVNGGNHGGGVQTSKFDITPKEILVYLKQGETSTNYFTIENKDSKKIDLTIESQSLENIIIINETKVSLNPGESKKIRVDFLTTETTLPNLYLGKIIAKTKDTQKEILVAVEVESKTSLFDVKMKILSKYKYVLPGEEVSAQIELYNVGSDKKVDVFLEYIIKDDKGNEIVKEQDTIAVETSTNFTKNIQIPKNLPLGRYVFYVKGNYNEKVASASSWFNVGEEPVLNIKNCIMALIAILLIYILVSIILKDIKKGKRRK